MVSCELGGNPQHCTIFLRWTPYCSNVLGILKTCYRNHSLETCVSLQNISFLLCVPPWIKFVVSDCWFFRDSPVPLTPLPWPPLESWSYPTLQLFAGHSQGTSRAVHRCRKYRDLYRAVGKAFQNITPYFRREQIHRMTGRRTNHMNYCHITCDELLSYHMWWIMLQMKDEIRIVLCWKHNNSFTDTWMYSAFVAETNPRAGCGIR